MITSEKPHNILRFIVELMREISLTDSLDKLINTFTTRFREIFPFQHFIIWIYNEELNVFSPAYSTIPVDRTISFDDDSLVITAIKENTAVYVVDFALEKRYRPLMEGSRSAIVLPLSSFGQVRGALHIESHTRDYFGGDTGSYLDLLVTQLSVILRNYYLFNQVNSFKTYLDTLIEKMNAVMVIMDGLGRIKRVNEAAEKFTEYSKGELIGTLGINLVPSEERRQWLTSIVSGLRKGEFFSGVELELLTKSGNRRIGLFNFGGIITDKRRLKEIIAIGQDITKTKEIEMKLMQAEKLALLGQISSSILHDMNNPLLLISSYAEVMLMRARSEGRDDDVNKLRVILESVDRLIKLSQNLMGFVRPSGDEFTRVNLNQAIEEALKWVEPMLRKGNINIIKEFEKGLPAIKGNKTEIQQIFLNLMSNSIHAMANRVGNIKILTERVNSNFAAMIVDDEGIGIKQHDLKRILDPFFTTKPAGKGTGLGLSIVQRIVERHNGKIVLNSTFGKGTTVKVILPLVEVEE